MKTNNSVVYKKCSLSKILFFCLILLFSVHCSTEKSNGSELALLLANSDRLLSGNSKSSKDDEAKSSKALIKAFVIEGRAGTISDSGTIKLQIPEGESLTNLTAKVTISEDASISPDPTKPTNYTKPVTFTVTAEDGTTKKYKVTVTMDPLLTHILSWTGGWRDNDTFTALIIDRNITIDVDSADFDTKVTLKPGITLNPNPDTVTDWTNEVEFVTNAPTNQTYKVKVTVNGKDIIKVNDRNIKTTMENERTKLGETGNFNHIDVSEVTNMKDLFRDKTDFNGDITKWATSKVTTMENMFYSARAFNQDIGDWDTSKVTNMRFMFGQAKAFNQNIGGWNTSKVTTMFRMFESVTTFNQNIGGWDTSKVKTMDGMFYEATYFNKDISFWNTSNVTNMEFMFQSARAFNQDISGWDTSKVRNMENMFNQALVFNQDIGGWNTSKVWNMQSMFMNARSFDQNIGGWNTSNVWTMQNMFRSAHAFNQNIGNWNTSKVNNMLRMFMNARSFDQDISDWDVAQVRHYKYFSTGSPLRTAFKPAFR